MTAPLDRFRIRAERLRLETEHDRATRQRAQLHRMANAPPVSIAALLPSVMELAELSAPRRTLLEQLAGIDAELHALLAREAPTIYAEFRRPLVRLMRQARRAIRETLS